MSEDMPKHSTPANSVGDLANTAKLDEIKLKIAESKQNIKKAEQEKALDDTEALRDNAKTINALGKFLVWLFFGSKVIECKIKFKVYFIFGWIALYVGLNWLLKEFLDHEKSWFYISLIDKVGLFLIVCILGKFLKDNISNIIKVFDKK